MLGGDSLFFPTGDGRRTTGWMDGWMDGWMRRLDVRPTTCNNARLEPKQAIANKINKCKNCLLQQQTAN